jgi:hypothetical protein
MPTYQWKVEGRRPSDQLLGYCNIVPWEGCLVTSFFLLSPPNFPRRVQSPIQHGDILEDLRNHFLNLFKRDCRYVLETLG